MNVNFGILHVRVDLYACNIETCINVPSLFCSKGTQDSWSVPRGEDRGHLGQNGIPKEGVTRPVEVTLELVPQVGGPVR